MEREKRGAVFLCVHQGNWEWASVACGILGFGNMVVTESFKNPRLTDVFRRLRQTSGQVIIPQENSLIRMLKVAKRGGATGMLIDLNLAPSQAATVIEGFGMKMCVPLIHAVLAQRGNAMLVPVETRPNVDGTCQVIAHPEVEWPPGRDAPANLPKVLGFLRADHPRTPGALALAIQTFPLQTARSHKAVSLLLERVVEV